MTFCHPTSSQDDGSLRLQPAKELVVWASHLTDYNRSRPHSSLGNLTPEEYRGQLVRTQTMPMEPVRLSL